MFRIEKLRKTTEPEGLFHRARPRPRWLWSSEVLGASTLGWRPPTPQNFAYGENGHRHSRVGPCSPELRRLQLSPLGPYNVGPTVILPKTTTTYTFTALYPGNTYTFGIFAKNAAGQTSTQANVNGIRLPNDTTPPTTAPIVSIDEVGSNYANISWIPAQDDGPHLSTQIYLNGSFYYGVGRGITTATLRFLQPGTTYNLTARAVDFGNNAGPFSNPIALVTPPVNPNDTTPPTTPANLYASGTGDGSTETHISWTQSTDAFDVQSNIRYDVYVNGVFQEARFGSGGESIVYAEFGENLIEVTATDTAGNTSAPAPYNIL